jgi:Macrocin-O-methyltransferase (TylF)
MAVALHWTEVYANMTRDLLGIALPSDFRAQKINSCYLPESEWFERSFRALFAIELEYVEHLLLEIKTQKVPGEFVEFGIFQGAWINRLYEMTERAGLGDRQIWGFDSFAGLSRPHPSADTSFWKEGMYAVPRSEVETNVLVAERPRIHLVEGFFSESLKSAAAARLGEVALARVDCDIYEPALDCLRYLGLRLANGSVLVFDDWAHHQDYGETRAFFEWVPSVPHLRFEFLCFGPWDHCYMRVWHK